MIVRPLAVAALVALAATAAVAAGVATDIIPLPLNPVIAADKRACAQAAPSGLGYTVLKPGTGRKPTDADIVLIDYIGYLRADGQVFDQSVQAPMPVAGVIPGFSEGLKMMPLGATYRFCIPAALGYGAKPAGQIPANSDLVFQVELLDAKTEAEVEAMRPQGGAQ